MSWLFRPPARTLIVLMLVTFFQPLSMFVPNLMMG